jgi:hypothetical protein
MTIKLKVEELKKKEKEFPKLMANKEGNIVYVIDQINDHYNPPFYRVLYINGFGDNNGRFFSGFDLSTYIDYNDPITITIQNA